MIQLTPASAKAFVSRFGTCFDGVVRKIQMELGNGHMVFLFTLEAQDETRKDDDSWVTLQVGVEEVIHYRFRQSPRTQFQVLSDGVSLGFFDGVVYFDLAPRTDEPDGVDDYLRSDAYCAGGAMWWRLVPS